ncbi:hypothetical protein K501DRAFT_287429 [Backusella circina FSU 941]|nr:hypothetical protein K501DRAFT_287429 [Backusella circina FSU 941]
MDRTDASLEARRQRRYAKLNAEIKLLAKNLTTLDNTVRTATSQLPTLRKVSALHGSLMYASHEAISESNQLTKPQ